MTKLIALEASAETCSVTLLTPSVCQSLESSLSRSHSQLLLPYIDQLLKANDLELSDLDLIACSKGPGSFTGLRIGFSVAQGLAFGANLPMVLVSSLECMARKNCRDLLESTQQNDHVTSEFFTITVVDARMDQVYWAVYQHISEGTAPVTFVTTEVVSPSLAFSRDAVTGIHLLASRYGPDAISIVGNGVSELLKSELETVGLKMRPEIMPDSKMTAELALNNWKADCSVDASHAELTYLRDTVSWQKRIRIR